MPAARHLPAFYCSRDFRFLAFVFGQLIFGVYYSSRLFTEFCKFPFSTVETSSPLLQGLQESLESTRKWLYSTFREYWTFWNT